MKLIHKSTDERVNAEVNRIYKICYYILTFGIGLDLLLQVCGTLPAGGGAPFRPMEFVVFMAAQLVGVVLLARKGFMDDNAFAESDTFPAKHYLCISLAGGTVAGLIMVAVNYFTSEPWRGLNANHLFIAALTTFLFLFIFTAVAIYAIYYVTFRIAKRRRDRQAAAEDGDDEA